MKIRQGFVSNSSSASYIVTLNKPFTNEHEFLLEIYESCWCAISENEEEWFVAKANADRRHQEFIDQAITTIENGPFDIFRLEERVERVRVSQNYEENVISKLHIMRYTFEQEGITIKKNDNGKYTLSYFTSMHNSFNDMNSLLKNIYLEFLVYKGGAILEVEDDN